MRHYLDRRRGCPSSLSWVRTPCEGLAHGLSSQQLTMHGAAVACVTVDFAVEHLRLQWHPTGIDVAIELDRGLSSTGWCDPFDEAADDSPPPAGTLDDAFPEGDTEVKHQAPLPSGARNSGSGSGSGSGAGSRGRRKPPPRHAASARHMRPAAAPQAQRTSRTRDRTRASSVSGGSSFAQAQASHFLSPVSANTFTVTRAGWSRMKEGMTEEERGEMGIAPHMRTGYDFSGTTSAFGPGGGNGDDDDTLALHATMARQEGSGHDRPHSSGV